MKIYRSNNYQREGLVCRWHSSYAEARIDALSENPYKPDGEIDPEGEIISTTEDKHDFSDGRVERFEVKSTKKDLLEWLNTNLDY